MEFLGGWLPVYLAPALPKSAVILSAFAKDQQSPVFNYPCLREEKLGNSRNGMWEQQEVRLHLGSLKRNKCPVVGMKIELVLHGSSERTGQAIDPAPSPMTFCSEW